MTVGDDNIADSTVGNDAALILKHSQRDICTVPDPVMVETSKLHVHKAMMFFPNWCRAGSDDISPQSFENLPAYSKSRIGKQDLSF